ncbi:hypothetical protein cypCar_00018399 [Cyprinus carpio]|nr:hypothetical protein cypCar_00018399 [Cyprinus carpio]
MTKSANLPLEKKLRSSWKVKKPLTEPEDFPELETLWLLTRAWNTGILLYSLAQYPKAERWCRLGMSFLKHLGSLQDSYQTPVMLQEADGPPFSCLSA